MTPLTRINPNCLELAPRRSIWLGPDSPESNDGSGQLSSTNATEVALILIGRLPYQSEVFHVTPAKPSFHNSKDSSDRACFAGVRAADSNRRRIRFATERAQRPIASVVEHPVLLGCDFTSLASSVRRR